MSAPWLAIDPGPTVCGVVWYDPVERVAFWPEGERSTESVLADLRDGSWYRGAEARSLFGVPIAIEDIDARGMPAGHDLIETIRTVGRLQELAGDRGQLIKRSAVKLALCGTPRAKDSNVNAALRAKFCDWLSLDEAEIKGRKKAPGPLYGVVKHAWSALAVAVVAAHGKELG